MLERPADCCDVAALPPNVYVALARKLHVRFEGPPSPSAFSPRASFSKGPGRAQGSPVISYLPVSGEYLRHIGPGRRSSHDVPPVLDLDSSAEGSVQAAPYMKRAASSRDNLVGISVMTA